MQLRALVLSAILVSLYGCVAQGDDATPAAAADALLPGETLPLSTPVAFDGQSGPAAGTCVPVQCVFQASPDSETVFPVDVSGTIVGANLTLTWDAVSPATDALVLGIAYTDADGEKWEFVEGPSPLVLNLSGLALPADNVAVYVNAYKCQGGGVASACASGPAQPFHVEGEIFSIA